MEEVGDRFQLPLAVFGVDPVHRAVHSRVEAKEIRQAFTSGADDDAATVRRVALAGDPTSAFEPVEDPGDGGGMQPGQSRECARAHWPFAVDEIEAIDVDVPELEFRADLMVEQGQLDRQLT